MKSKDRNGILKELVVNKSLARKRDGQSFEPFPIRPAFIYPTGELGAAAPLDSNGLTDKADNSV